MKPEANPTFGLENSPYDPNLRAAPGLGRPVGGGSTGQRTRRAYDLSAARYHDRFSAYGPYCESIRGFVDRLPRGGRVLDLGCGSGANARRMSEAGLEVKGYDFSASMLEIARRQCPAGVFELADLRELEETDRFGAVLASFCIVHLQDHEAAAFLSGLPALLDDGGLLHLSFMEGRESAWSVPTFSDEPLFYNYFDRRWIAETLATGGLEALSCSTHDYPEADGSTTTDVFLEFAKPRRR